MKNDTLYFSEKIELHGPFGTTHYFLICPDLIKEFKSMIPNGYVTFGDLELLTDIFCEA